MKLLSIAIAALIGCNGACGGGGGGGVDAGPVSFMAEYVDWDSSSTGAFCGIFKATWTSHDDTAVTVTTNPNGRVTLNLPSAPQMRIDITPPTGGSECTTPTGQLYNIPGIAIVDRAVNDAGGEYSTRSLSTTRATAFGYNPAKAQVMVHVDGTPGSVSLTGSHDATQAFDGSAWAAGDTGVNVFFPNVDPSSGNESVGTSGSAIGTGSIPVVAGTFTYLSIIEN
ncbi:MAG TPA: hypothetical protein VGO00_25760 [Kofleriaceae bacterium]|nr:hypothetical protein [Kofleriaceae bacterium]